MATNDGRSTTSDADVIQNQINLLLANQKRLLQSWLPPLSVEERANVKSADEMGREEEAIFRPMPANLGVGAPLPKHLSDAASTTTTVKSPTADERLRKKLLGKRATHHPSRGVEAGNAKSSRKKPRSSSMLVDDFEDDDDAGRSSLGKSKRPTSSAVPDPIVAVDDDGDGDDAAAGAGHDDDKRSPETHTSKDEPIRSSKRPSSFLDVILAERSRKRRRKRRGKQRSSQLI